MMFRNKKSEEKLYKFKDLKIYSSPEWLANGMRKYRTVFESIETSYLYVELSFYNKLFDVEESLGVAPKLALYFGIFDI